MYLKYEAMQALSTVLKHIAWVNALSYWTETEATCAECMDINTAYN